MKVFREKKNSVVKKQKYEEAAKLRDDEKRIEKELFIVQEEWQETQKENRVTVNESDIADVVSMMTGIPVNRVAESESIRLNNLADQIKEKKLLVKTRLLKKLYVQFKEIVQG